MSDPYNFVAPGQSKIFDGIWVTELPDTVNINVSVKTDEIVTFTSFRAAASRLAVSAHAPEIVIETGSGTAIGRLEIWLKPRLLIRDTVGRP